MLAVEVKVVALTGGCSFFGFSPAVGLAVILAQTPSFRCTGTRVMEVEGRLLDDDGSVPSSGSIVDAWADGLSVVASAADSSTVAIDAYGPVPDRDAGCICSCCNVEDLDNDDDDDDDDDDDGDTADEKKDVSGSTIACLRVEDAAVAMPCVRACIFCTVD